MMGSLGNASRSIRTVSPTPRLWPCAVETATTSRPRSTSPPTWVRMRSRSSSPNAFRVADTAAPQISRKCASRAGLNCAFRSCVMRSTSLIVISPCSRSWSSTTSSLWMPGWSVKNLSALAMGSRPSSFLLSVWTWPRGVSASATLRLA